MSKIGRSKNMKIFSRKEERGLSMNIQQDSYWSILIREDYTVEDRVNSTGKEYLTWHNDHHDRHAEMNLWVIVHCTVNIYIVECFF